jgi:hypothetical protein
MAFKPVFDAGNAQVRKFENVGDQLEGYYMGSFDFEGDYGPNKKHVFQTSNGAEVVFGQAHLKQLLPSVKPGTMVRITLTGELAAKKKGRQPMKMFQIEQDTDNVTEVTGVDFNATDSSVDEGPDTDVDSEESSLDEAPPARATAPARPAAAPTADRIAAVQARLSGKLGTARR